MASLLSKWLGGAKGSSRGTAQPAGGGRGGQAADSRSKEDITLAELQDLVDTLGRRQEFNEKQILQHRRNAQRCAETHRDRARGFLRKALRLEKENEASFNQVLTLEAQMAAIHDMRAAKRTVAVMQSARDVLRDNQVSADHVGDVMDDVAFELDEAEAVRDTFQRELRPSNLDDDELDDELERMLGANLGAQLSASEEPAVPRSKQPRQHEFPAVPANRPQPAAVVSKEEAAGELEELQTSLQSWAALS